jgi:hypothetical protein
LIKNIHLHHHNTGQKSLKNRRGTPWWAPFLFRGMVRGKRFIKEGGLFPVPYIEVQTNFSSVLRNK